MAADRVAAAALECHVPTRAAYGSIVEVDADEVSTRRRRLLVGGERDRSAPGDKSSIQQPGQCCELALSVIAPAPDVDQVGVGADVDLIDVAGRRVFGEVDIEAVAGGKGDVGVEVDRVVAGVAVDRQRCVVGGIDRCDRDRVVARAGVDRQARGRIGEGTRFRPASSRSSCLPSAPRVADA